MAGHSPHPGLFSHLCQVLGASEEPTQFTLTNPTGTHNTSEGISSPSPGELVFSSFHSLPPGPYFWSLPPRFLGDKVGRGCLGPLRKRLRPEQRQDPRVGPQLSACPPRVPGDLLWWRAALYDDPAAPAWLRAPAWAAAGGPAGQ